MAIILFTFVAPICLSYYALKNNLKTKLFHLKGEYFLPDKLLVVEYSVAILVSLLDEAVALFLR